MVKNTKNEKVSKDLEELKVKAEDFENKYKRVLADYQNLERRVANERQELVKSANRDLLLRLLPALDTLILASQHIQDEGLKLAITQFENSLESVGVKKIEAKEKSFDPKFMECVETQEGEEGKVLEEVRAGYMLFDKVLRPAQVKVGAEQNKTQEGEVN